MRKLISLLLALVLVLSIVPLTALAAPHYIGAYQKGNDWYGVTANGKEQRVTINTANDILTYWEHADDTEELKALAANHAPNAHTWGVQYNAKYHWLGCACGIGANKEPHIDPKEAADDYCTCGYHFSDNADLVTLWVKGCPPIEDFDKDTTEYTLNAYTYKDVKKVKISTRTYDSEATVELPEDLTLKEGTNTIEVKVIAENQKNTKTYTLTIVKE